MEEVARARAGSKLHLQTSRNVLQDRTLMETGMTSILAPRSNFRNM